jgi:transcriptional regulator with XRE-family HTH domain
MKKPQTEHVGKKIKRIRTINGMTQEEMAKAINKTRSMVSHIERTGEVNYHTLEEIAKVLKFSVDKIHEYDTKQPLIFNEIGEQKGSEQELIIQLKEEIAFLKNTIHHQWKILLELAK